MDSKPTRALIIQSMEDSRYKWRTARGISKDTGLPMNAVMDFLDGSDAIMRSGKSNKQGQALFTTRKKYKKGTPFYSRMVSAIINRAN